MGLDQYAYSVLKTEEIQTADDITNKAINTVKEEPVLNIQEEIAYWRKHPNLQGFMENLWRERCKVLKDNPDLDFNCVPVGLTEKDLDELEKAVKSRSLPETSGFFFGSDSSEYYEEEDLAFIATAREEIAEGKLVYYTSWW